MSTTSTGFVYRYPMLDATGVGALIERFIRGGSVFGGNIVKLDSVHTFAAAIELDEALKQWDFGHAFSPTLEVRWRRSVHFDSDQPDTFDTLLLADEPITGLAGGEEIIESWILRRSTPDTHILLTGNTGAKLAYTRYVARNETVQFTRYMEVV